MARSISISIPDEMFEKIQELKDEFGSSRDKKKISAICQDAIQEFLNIAEAKRVYRLEGIKDGQKMAAQFSDADKKYISKILSKSGPYRNWSKFDKVEELKRHFEKGYYQNIKELYPRFVEIMDGTCRSFHMWVDLKGGEEAEDRRAEMAWSYVAGIYEGIIN